MRLLRHELLGARDDIACDDLHCLLGARDGVLYDPAKGMELFGIGSRQLTVHLEEGVLGGS